MNPFKKLYSFILFSMGMERSTALSLFSQCEQLHIAKDHTILNSFETRLGLYLVVEGEVEVLVPNKAGGKEEILEIISEAGIVGLSSLYSAMEKEEVEGGLYSSVEVKAKEECVLCLVPYTSLQSHWSEPYLKGFLLTETSKRLQDVYYSLSKQAVSLQRLEQRTTFLKRVEEMMTKNIITVQKESTLKEAARIMGENRVSSVIVLDHQQIVGILTERDLVTRCIGGTISLTQSVTQGMTPNPITINQEAYLYEALSVMMENSIKHLPVIKRDGPVGVITLQDVMKAQHIGVLTGSRKLESPQFPLEKIKSLTESMLAGLWNAQAPVFHILDFMSGVIDRIYQRVVKQAEHELKEEGWQKPCSYAFYVMGSAGRKEQFMLTDQDHFLVYEKRDEQSKEYFEIFAEKIVNLLEKAGFQRCDGGMMSNQKPWRWSVERWEEQIREWSIHSSEEALLKVQNFFSYRFIHGNDRLHHQFQKVIDKQLKRSRILLQQLAQLEKTKQVPVLHSSIRSLLGMERNTISIKKEILFPFHHALQLLNLAHGNTNGSTLNKIQFLKEKGSISSEFEEELREAFQEIMKLNVDVKRNNQGDLIHFSILSTRKKENLYQSVKTMREFQQMMFAHFSLS